MKMHIEYDDFGEYLEVLDESGELEPFGFDSREEELFLAS